MIRIHLAELMARKKIKVKYLAPQVGLTPKTLIDIKYERAHRISFRVLDKLCGVLGCTTSELLEYVAEEKV